MTSQKEILSVSRLHDCSQEHFLPDRIMMLSRKSKYKIHSWKMSLPFDKTLVCTDAVLRGREEVEPIKCIVVLQAPGNQYHCAALPWELLVNLSSL